MIPPRQREAEAIAVLIALHLDGPDEWLPEHYDTADEAARVIAPWLRRARVGEDVPVKRKSSGATMRSRKPVDGPTDATRIFVEQRARGFCEVAAVGCAVKGHHLHHRLMRSQGGGHDSANLLLVCWRCHDYVHAHPELAYERCWLLHAVPVVMAAKCNATTAKGRSCGRWALPGSTRCGVHPMAHGDGQPRLEDGTVDVRALCARWDADANRGAGDPR